MLISYMLRGLGVDAVSVSYADGLEGYALHIERKLAGYAEAQNAPLCADTPAPTRVYAVADSKAELERV